jgi:hypothetical protein
MGGICRRGPGGQEPPRSDQAVLDDRHPDGKPALPGLCDCVDRHTSSDYRWVTTARRSACRSGPYSDPNFPANAAESAAPARQ